MAEAAIWRSICGASQFTAAVSIAASTVLNVVVLGGADICGGQRDYYASTVTLI